jgi:hypothetical protein
MSSRADEAGFALAEAVAALLVLSVLGGIALGFASSALGAIGRSGRAARSAAVLLGAEAAIRDAAAEVRIPYWERRAALLVAEGRASAPFFRGDPRSRLELAWEGGSLAVSRGGGTGDVSRIAPLRILGVGPLRGRRGELRGIVVSVEVEGRACAIAASFGQGPLRLGGD